MNEFEPVSSVGDMDYSVYRDEPSCADRAMDDGHCGLPTEELSPLAEKLLIPQELIRTALDLELQEGTVIADRLRNAPCVSGRPVSRGAHHCRTVDAAGKWRAAWP